MQKQLIKTIALCALAAILYFIPNLSIPGEDKLCNAYFEETFTKAASTYLTCRVINATVSVAKESTLQGQPGGIGVSIAAGQILDPIDDMVERLSDVLVTAIASIGVQKIGYEIITALAPPMVAFLLILYTILIWIQGDRSTRFRNHLLKGVIILLLSRLCFPACAFRKQHNLSQLF